jgi:hypothetical protein
MAFKWAVGEKMANWRGILGPAGAKRRRSQVYDRQMGKNRTFASGAKSFIGLLILLNGMSGIFILPSARSEETLETENSESQTIGLSENFYKTLDKVKKTGERKLECPKNSARLILPENNTVIETALAEAFISADSLAVIIQNKDTVAAYILVGKSANYLSRGGEKILIRTNSAATSPGN